jgi:hypothetical protein
VDRVQAELRGFWDTICHQPLLPQTPTSLRDWNSQVDFDRINARKTRVSVRRREHRVRNFIYLDHWTRVRRARHSHRHLPALRFCDAASRAARASR